MNMTIYMVIKIFYIIHFDLSSLEKIKFKSEMNEIQVAVYKKNNNLASHILFSVLFFLHYCILATFDMVQACI